MRGSTGHYDPHGSFARFASFASHYVAPRAIDIWLPPNYHCSDRRFPVLYMHDGQNLFDPALSYSGVPWAVDHTIVWLAHEGRIAETIVVGIWNTPRRRREYMPQAPYRDVDRTMRAVLLAHSEGPPLSDAYLRFIAEELKPWVDAAYRTRPERAATMLMGSSMGGLISLYGVTRYPHVFGAAGCLSTHWPAGGSALTDYFARVLPAPGSHRFYFDFGTEGVDAPYEPYQHHFDNQLRAAGYQEGRDFQSLKFAGADHNEAAWRDRLHLPLTFLLGGR